MMRAVRDLRFVFSYLRFLVFQVWGGCLIARRTPLRRRERCTTKISLEIRKAIEWLARGARPHETTKEVRGLRHVARSSRCEGCVLLFEVFGA